MELDAMLCDYAEVAAGKLFITGAAIDRMDLQRGAPPPYGLSLSVAGVVRVPWTATNSEHSLQCRFLTEDGRNPQLPEGVALPDEGISGELRFNIGRPPHATTGQEQLVPFAFNFQAVPLMEAGGYAVKLSVDGTEMRSLWFNIVRPEGTSTFVFPPRVG